MSTVSLMLDIDARDISELVKMQNTLRLNECCESEHQAAALSSLLEEIVWQLASVGNEAAIAALAARFG